jgi:hypothetical protein
MKTKCWGSVPLPLVGTESYRLIGCMFPIRVTFLLTQPRPILVTLLNDLTGGGRARRLNDFLLPSSGSGEETSFL